MCDSDLDSSRLAAHCRAMTKCTSLLRIGLFSLGTLAGCGGTQSFDNDEDGLSRNNSAPDASMSDDDSSGLPEAGSETDDQDVDDTGDTTVEAAAPVISLNADAAGTEVPAPVGVTIELLLQTIGPGDYGTPEISSDAVQFVEVVYPELQNPGGPRQLFRFLTASVGTAEIHLPHSGNAMEFVFTVVVQ